MNTIKINEKEATNLKGEDLVGGKWGEGSNYIIN